MMMRQIHMKHKILTFQIFVNNIDISFKLAKIMHHIITYNGTFHFCDELRGLYAVINFISADIAMRYILRLKMFNISPSL